jgi:hypothetical protein
MERASKLHLIIAESLLFAASCAPAGRLDTPSGQPRIAVHGADWKSVSVAIANYNLSKGRKLDLATQNGLVLYDAAPSIVGDASSEGAEQVTSKTVYEYTFFPDSVIISSHRYWTSDLDDTTATEASDQATYDAEQQELSEIATLIEPPSIHGGLAAPIPSR